MTTDVYNRLRARLDELSIGFPATESGVELKILKKLFTEEEAGMALQLTMFLETPDDIAQRIGKPPEQTTELLNAMADKGLIFRLRKEDRVKFAVSPFVVGVYEFQVKTMDKELAGLIEEFVLEGFHDRIAHTGNLMRPIPINRSVSVTHPVATYNDSRKIVAQQKFIAVADCICRKQQELVGAGCDKPREVCFVFGSHGKYYIDKGMAREITVEEANAILDEAEKAGLVTQPYNTQNPGGMCNCCGDCCGILRALNKLPNPAEAVVSNYYAVVDPETCIGCETCLDRCQMDALFMNDDGLAEVKLNRCIGCGLCVPTCPSEAVTLAVKPEEDQKQPPEDGKQQMVEMAQNRGVPVERLITPA